MADSSPIGPWRERMANLSPDRHALAWGTGIAVLGLAIRATNLLDFTELPWFWVPRVDSDVYHRAAKRVAHGDLSLRGISEGLSTAYFYFLGAVYRLCGDDAWAPRLVQAVLGVGTGLLVWRTARRVAGPWLGVV
ncbi:MAG: glycosyltransferase family 39 protein, partial [Myxococcales bacterium]|nr:glycosyltransferase family 39 protein [Myxococcales bacterium]